MTDDIRPEPDVGVLRASPGKPPWQWTPLITVFSAITVFASLTYAVLIAIVLAPDQPDYNSQGITAAMPLIPLAVVVIVVAATISGVRGGTGRVVGLVCGCVALSVPVVLLLIILSGS